MQALSDSANPATAPAAPKPSWVDTIKVYLQPASLRMLALGFSAGLPLLLVLGTLSFRLREAGIDRSTIGYLSWVGLAYGFKWAWAPLVDRVPLPGLTRLLGRRRSWLLLAQLGVAAGLVGMALADPRVSLTAVVWCALAVAFASATQDIALDAYRIESAPTEQQPALAATYQTGYRLAMIWAGAGVLWLAAITRYAICQAALILALIAVYRISDVVMGIMANPFYVDMGYTKDEVAAVTKIYGVIMTLVGAFVGGSLALRFGVMRILMLGALLSALTNLLFAWLAGHGHSVPALIMVVSADNLASGIASAAFVGYLSSLTNISNSATQYALFSSLMLLLPKFVAGFSGDYVNAFGYAGFFTSTALLGLPVLLLVALAARAQRRFLNQNSTEPAPDKRGQLSD